MFERTMLKVLGFGPVAYMAVHQWRLGAIWVGGVLALAISRMLQESS